MGSGGSGTSLHMCGEMFRMMTGITMQHVPYRGEAPAVTDLIGGQVDVLFSNMPASVEYIRSGKLRALAVTTATRSQALPDIAPLGDFVRGYDASGLIGLGAPRGTPSEVIERLNREINAALNDARMQKRFSDLGAVALPGTPAEFGKFLADEVEKWAKVAKFAGIKLD